MTPSLAPHPRVRYDLVKTDEYDLINITLSDKNGGILGVLTYDRLSDKVPVLVLVAGAVTTTVTV